MQPENRDTLYDEPEEDDGDPDSRYAGRLRRWGWFPTDDCLPDGSS